MRFPTVLLSRALYLLIGLASLCIAPQSTLAGDRPRICLVLSGGGARGVAHIGVLKVLEEYRVPIDCVVGTSMGAIVGGVYAAGLSPAEIEEVVRGTQWGQVLFDDPPRAHGSIYFKELERDRIGSAEAGFRDGGIVLPTGAVTGQYLGTFLQHMVRSAVLTSSFDKLPIPFRAIATDIETGEMVVLAEGELSSALRASMSVPGVFAPYDVNGRILIDGGLVRNLGVDVARSMGADVVIAVNLGTSLLRRESLGSVIGIATQTLNILTEQNVQRSIAELGSDDVLISPALGTFGSGDFQHSLDTVPLGEAAARDKQERLRSLGMSAQAYAAWLSARRHPAGDLQFHTVKVDGKGLKRVDPAMVEAIVKDDGRQQLTTVELDRKLTALLNTNDFQTIDIDLTKADSGYDVILTPIEKSWGPNYLHAGMALTTDLNGESGFDLLFDSRMTWLTAGGLEWRNRASLGDHIGLHSELRQPLDMRHDWFVAPSLSFLQQQVDIFNGGESIARYRKRNWFAGLALGREIGALGEAQLSYQRGQIIGHRATGIALLPDFAKETGALRAGLVLDSFDNLDFPRSGYLIELDALLSRPALGSSDAYEKVDLGAEWAFGDKLQSVTLGARHMTSLGSELQGYDAFEIGGFLSMSGLARGQILARGATLLHVVYRRQIGAFARLLPGIYIGGSAEYADLHEQLNDDAQRNPRRYGGSLFVAGDTVLGPLYLGTGYTEGGDLQFYLYVGRPNP